jgi:hypothetical protein
MFCTLSTGFGRSSIGFRELLFDPLSDDQAQPLLDVLYDLFERCRRRRISSPDRAAVPMLAHISQVLVDGIARYLLIPVSVGCRMKPATPVGRVSR